MKHPVSLVLAYLNTKQRQGKLTLKSTRDPKARQEQEQTKSAISDHAARANHIIDWEETEIIGREHNRRSREVREAMEIIRRGNQTLNREEGAILLSHVYERWTILHMHQVNTDW